MAVSALRACATYFLVLTLMNPGEAIAAVAASSRGPSVGATQATVVAKRRKRPKGKKKRHKKAVAPATAEEKPTPAVEPPASPEPPTGPTGAVEPLAETVPPSPPPAVDPAALEAPPTALHDESAGDGTPAKGVVVETVEAKAIDTVAETVDPRVETAMGSGEETREAVFPLTCGVELGVGFPQLVSDLRTAFVPSLEIGYLLPNMEQRLEVFVSGGYSSPDQSKVLDDPRFTNGEDFRFRITEEELLTTLGGVFRLLPPRTWLNVYGQAGVQVRWQRSEVRGNANGEPLGVSHETKTEVGAMMAGGVELLLGPGALAAELGFAFSDLDHRVTGESSAGGLTLHFGYHFLL